jgi:hypothetical protein
MKRFLAEGKVGCHRAAVDFARVATISSGPCSIVSHPPKIAAGWGSLDRDGALASPHRCHQKPKGVAKVATARKLAVRLYWMLRTNVAYPEIVRIESSPRVPLVGAS